MGKKMSYDLWRNVITNLDAEDEMVEVLWLDNGTSEDNNEWCLCFDTELFERGFKSEEEALARLDEIAKELGTGRLYD